MIYTETASSPAQQTINLSLKATLSYYVPVLKDL